MAMTAAQKAAKLAAEEQNRKDAEALLAHGGDQPFVDTGDKAAVDHPAPPKKFTFVSKYSDYSMYVEASEKWVNFHGNVFSTMDAELAEAMRANSMHNIDFFESN